MTDGVKTALCLLGALVLGEILIGLAFGQGPGQKVGKQFLWMLTAGVLYELSACAAELLRTGPAALFLCFRLLAAASFSALVPLTFRYVCLLAEHEGRRERVSRRILDGVCAVTLTAWAVELIRLILRGQRTFLRLPAWNEAASLLTGLLVCGVYVFFLLGNRERLHRRSAVSLVCFAVFPVLAGVAQGLTGIRYFMPVSTTVALLGMYVLIQWHQESRMIEEIEARERDRLQLVTGRMKPHFLYNCLTTIYILCDSDPAAAQKSVGVFSDFLRGVLDTLDRDELVPFTWELGQIRNYMYLERLRHGDRLRMEYDIRGTDFLVPPLSVQPLVENAVKHGFGTGDGPVTIRLTSEETPEGWTVLMEDDGVGFRPEAALTEENRRVGLRSVTERLRLTCGGALTVESAPGEGTRARITLPGSRPAEHLEREAGNDGRVV